MGSIFSKISSLWSDPIEPTKEQTNLEQYNIMRKLPHSECISLDGKFSTGEEFTELLKLNLNNRKIIKIIDKQNKLITLNDSLFDIEKEKQDLASFTKSESLLPKTEREKIFNNGQIKMKEHYNALDPKTKKIVEDFLKF